MRKVVKGGEVRFSVAASRESSLGLWALGFGLWGSGIRYPNREEEEGRVVSASAVCLLC